MQAALSTLFIVWRESIEALLVIGVLYAWLRKNDLQPQIIRLWLGSGLGLCLAGALAVVFFAAGHLFSGPAGDWFFAIMMLAAALLIMQMIVWMHRHGRNMKRQIEQEAGRSIRREGGLGIMLIAMIAVAREGSETVIFLAGIGAQYQGAGLGLFAAGGIIGFIAALASFLLLTKLANTLSWKWFFLGSEFILLLIGGAMMVAAADKISEQLQAYDLPDWAYGFIGDPLWSTQSWLPDGLASVLASLTGYRAQPSLMEVLALALYWAIALGLANRGKSAALPTANSAPHS